MRLSEHRVNGARSETRRIRRRIRSTCDAGATPAGRLETVTVVVPATAVLRKPARTIGGEAREAVARFDTVQEDKDHAARQSPSDAACICAGHATLQERRR
jgi:hypothetical protein